MAGESLLQSLSQLHLQCGVFPAQILGLISSGTKIILSLDIIYICYSSCKNSESQIRSITFILEGLKYIFRRIEIGVKC